MPKLDTRPVYVPSSDYLTLHERLALRARKRARRAILHHAARVLLLALCGAALACLLYAFAYTICDISPSASCHILGLR